MISCAAAFVFFLILLKVTMKNEGRTTVFCLLELVCYSLVASWCCVLPYNYAGNQRCRSSPRMQTLFCENSFKMEGLSPALFAWSPPGEQWAAQGCFTLNDVQGSLSSYLQASTSMEITQPAQLKNNINMISPRTTLITAYI